MALPRLKVNNAKSMEQACEQLVNENARVIGGGTDLLHGYKDSIYSDYASTIINLKSIPGFDQIEEKDGYLQIGALTTLHELENNSLINSKYSAIAQAAAQVATPQIRNQASIAGNICQEPRCWYYRNADNMFTCLRKGGEFCNAQTGQNEIHSVFGSARVKDTPCQMSCPSGIDIPVYMEKIRAGKWDEACEILMENNPLAALTGRVCPHFCQQGCNRGLIDEAVSIRGVERQLGDHILENADRFYRAPDTENGRRIAIIGAGPAGLTAAYFLRKNGYSVHVFEANKRAGGMLTYAIPSYRLPKENVDRLVNALVNMGIKFSYSEKISDKNRINELRKEFDSVLFCCGATKERNTGIEGEEALSSGIHFLHNVAEGILPEGLKNVAVLGGGNAAMDVAVTLKRLGCDVTIIYRRTRNEMPAIADDVEKAIEEGLNFSFLTTPVKAAKDGKGVKLTCVRMQLGEADASGRARPEPINGSEFDVSYDAVFTAFGEVPETDYLPEDLINEKNRFKASGNVDACGDYVTGASTVTQAMCGGKEAAKRIMGIVKAETGNQPVDRSALQSFDSKCLEESAAKKQEDIPISQRDAYREDNAGISKEQCLDEAKRCMYCGCVAACPSDLAPVLVAYDAIVVTTLRPIPAREFFGTGVCSSTVLNRGELVKKILIPEAKAGQKSVYLKYRQRKAVDFPLVSVALVADVEDGIIKKAGIGLGAVAPVPIRAGEAENFITGKSVGDEMAEEAGKYAVIGAEPLKNNRYKLRVVKAYVRRAILKCR